MHRRPARVVLSLAALAAASCAPAAPPAKPPAKVEAPPPPAVDSGGRPTATVWPTYAAFEFPLPRTAVWRWRLRETAPGAREYAWLVAIPDSAGRPAADPSTAGARDATRDALAVPARFEVGFTLFQPAAVATEPAEGSFQVLLTDGQSDLWERTEDGARRMPRVGVLVVPRFLRTGEASTLTIQVQDPVLVAQLFGARPAEVIAIEQLPGRPLRVVRVPVRYPDAERR